MSYKDRSPAFIYSQGSDNNAKYSLPALTRESIVNRFSTDPATLGSVVAHHLLPVIVSDPQGRNREGAAKHDFTIAQIISTIKIRLDHLCETTARKIGAEVAMIRVTHYLKEWLHQGLLANTL